MASKLQYLFTDIFIDLNLDLSKNKRKQQSLWVNMPEGPLRLPLAISKTYVTRVRTNINTNVRMIK